MTAGAPSLQTLAEAALAVLARGGTHEAHVGADDAPLDIRLTGPDVPATVPDEVAPPETIPKERPWQGVYRLVVTAPLIVFDLYWTPGEPLRIMSFSRGDWEQDLLAAAG